MASPGTAHQVPRVGWPGVGCPNEIDKSLKLNQIMTHTAPRTRQAQTHQSPPHAQWARQPAFCVYACMHVDNGSAKSSRIANCNHFGHPRAFHPRSVKGIKVGAALFAAVSCPYHTWCRYIDSQSVRIGIEVSQPCGALQQLLLRSSLC